MKIRAGFVSNSSSSSFVIAHTNYSTDEIKDIVSNIVAEQYEIDKIKHKDFYNTHSDWKKYDDKYLGTPEGRNEKISVYKFEDKEGNSYLKDFVKVKDGDIVIEDNDDNYFTEEVKKQIEKTFKIKSSCWHCG